MAIQTVEGVCKECSDIYKQFQEHTLRPEYSPWGIVDKWKQKQDELRMQFIKQNVSNDDAIKYCLSKCEKNIRRS